MEGTSFLEFTKAEVERLKDELHDMEKERRALRRRIRGLEKFISEEEQKDA